MRFVKLQGAGNDYLFINGFETKIDEEDLPELAERMSDRHFGVGADGIILILPSKKADFRMRMFNADGTEGEMCGNGIRGFSKYVHDRKMADGKQLTIETGAGLIKTEIIQEDHGRAIAVRVDMGRPRLARRDIPVSGEPADQRVIGEEIEVEGRRMKFTAISMGNPHAVFVVDQVSGIDLPRIGPQIENHSLFPRRTNVEFVQVVTGDELIMRVWERGSGITLACGTGASASVVACSLNGLAARRALVRVDGGQLLVDWAADDHVYLTGPTVEVFAGDYPY
ncbi:MAG TPA: diaminopimelate epimerase [Bacillota bacterium]